MKRPALAKLQRQCDDWNLANPVGTRIALQTDTRGVIYTTTRSAAEVLSGHSAVVWLEGVSGCYALDRVKAQS
jgi:hypothetical protein